MLDKQLEEYNKQKEEEQQKEEELNKASLVNKFNNSDTMDITIKDTSYSTIEVSDTSGTYSFKVILYNTDTKLTYLLCTKQLASANWSTACKYTWSANLKDASNNIYKLTDIRIPTKDQAASNTNSVIGTGFYYWTSTENEVNHKTSYLINYNGELVSVGTRTESYGVIPLIAVDLI